jgi:hypothetical protein
MTTLLRKQNFSTLLFGTAFGLLTIAATAAYKDVLMATWGGLSISSEKITNVKIADFQKNIDLPITFKVKEKDVTGVSAHVNIFPLESGNDPVQIDMIDGAFAEDARTILKNNAKWGTKIFIENPQYLLKGKVKIMPTIGIKLN